MRGGPDDSGAAERARRGLDDDETSEGPRAPSLGAARVADLGDGESTRADPTDEAELPVARPRSVRGRGASGVVPSVQVDAVEGERVPALVLRRSAQDVHDPATGVGRALAAPGAVDLASLMGRSLGSPVADAPPSRISLPAQGAPSGRGAGPAPEPSSRRSLPAQELAPSRSPAPEPSSRRSLPAQVGIDAPSSRISLPAPEPSSRRSLPAQDLAPSRSPAPEPSSRRSLPAQDLAPSRSPVPEPSSRRSLPAQVGIDAPSSRISLPAPEPSSRRSLPAQELAPSRSPVPEPSSRRSLPAQVGIDAPSSRISLPPPGRDSGGRRAAAEAPPDEVREAAAAREVTHIDVAAAIGLAPEPRALTRDADADDRTPPPRFALDLGRDAAPGGLRPTGPAAMSPYAALGEASVAHDERRAPRPRLPTALDLRQPIPMPTRALRAERLGSPWIPVFVGALVVGLLLLVVGTRRARSPAPTTPVAAVASLAAQAPAAPEGARGVRLVTRPARARVRVDGFELGLAPMLLRPREGRALYPLVVRAPGYKPWSGTLRVEHGTVTIEPGDPPAPGAVVVTSDDDGPAVSVALEHE